MRQINLGIIGGGGRGIHSFGRVFREHLASTAGVVALAETNHERGRLGVKSLGGDVRLYADYHDLLADENVDAVIVTTPDHTHEQIAMDALRCGKHTLVDKPLAITAAGCLRVLEAAEESAGILYMGFNLRHDPVLARLKALVDEMAFGELFTVQAIEHYTGGRTYMGRWHRFKAYSGGLFIHKGSHDFDIINWLLAPARPQRVSCFGGVAALHRAGLPFEPSDGVEVGPHCADCHYAERCPDRRCIEEPEFSGAAAAEDGYRKDTCMYLSRKDVHDHGMALVEYDNGAVAMHSECFVTPLSNRQFFIEGDRGVGRASLKDDRVEVFPRWTQDRMVHEVTRGAGGHGGADPIMCRHFIECIQRGEPPRANGIDGVWSVAVGEAAELARAERRVVEITELLDTTHPLLKISSPRSAHRVC